MRPIAAVLRTSHIYTKKKNYEMNLYTSDALLVEQIAGADTEVLAVEQGQQLISVYRLFLQLHHAGSGTMRIKDMLKPESAEAAAGEISGDKGADRRSSASRGTATLTSNWGSQPSMPEAASAYSSNIAAVSTGTPYPMFLLSSNAIPATHRLRGFASGRSLPSAGVLTKNNNRSCNGCEEIPLRWSLLTKQALTTTTNTTAAPVVQEKKLEGAESGPGATASAPSTATSTTTKNSTAGVGESASRDTAQLGGGGQGSVGGGADGVVTTGASATVAAVAPSHAASPALRAFASGWCAAELQVHTTRRVLICTATEMSLDEADFVEDGNTPLVFCCSVQPNVA